MLTPFYTEPAFGKPKYTVFFFLVSRGASGRILSRLPAEHRAQSHNPKIKSRTPNRLSHPGASKIHTSGYRKAQGAVRNYAHRIFRVGMIYPHESREKNEALLLYTSV